MHGRLGNPSETPATLPRRTHLVGIGGSGMRSLTDVLLGWGWSLSGSDTCLRPSAAASLAASGVRIHNGHHAANVPVDADAVVASDAVRPDCVELRRARAIGIPTKSYFEMLGHLMTQRHGLAVAGTHGKSTVTAMAAQLLVDAGLDPTVVCGAAPLGSPSGGRAGRGRLMLVEACEYRANFLRLGPKCAVILGIEPDHFDCYRSTAELEAAFRRFAENIARDGILLARHDCAATRRATAELTCRVETFGLDADADWSARQLRRRGGRYTFSLFRRTRPMCDVRLAVPGRHNVLNAVAAAALAWHQRVAPETIAAGLARFAGIGRRLETLPPWRQVARLDDYAHHPTEVFASLDTVRQIFPGRRVWCVFQPHQVSRTEHLLDELALSLQNADKVLVAEIFRAREGSPRPGEVTAADLAARTRDYGADAICLPDRRRMVRLLKTQMRPHDVLITMGAGDIGRVQDDFVSSVSQGVRENRQAG